MYMAVEHDTGGANSYNICKWGREGYNAGLCQILLPKVGTPWQFCEIDAICYHAGSSQYGDYNPFGPGFEVERFQGEPLSPDQAEWMGRIIKWLESEWGLPAVHYWGPQFPWWGADFHGHVNHRDIHPNPDGLSNDEWNRCLGAAGPGPTPVNLPKDGEMLLISEDGGGFFNFPKNSFFLNYGDVCVCVGVGQTLEQVMHNWGALPRCPVPQGWIDSEIFRILTKEQKVNKIMTKLGIPV